MNPREFYESMGLEMPAMMYVLDGHEAIAFDHDIEACVILHGVMWDDRAQIVAQDRIGDLFVSTVFLGVNHAFLPGPPMIFETMIFEGDRAGDLWRYSTWDEAEAGHRRVCEEYA